jgi:hypothetical protein
MKQQYEYLFVRVGEGLLFVGGAAEREYQRIIRDHARDGWRLVQIFAPSTGAYGASKYYEIVLERPVE